MWQGNGSNLNNFKLKVKYFVLGYFEISVTKKAILEEIVNHGKIRFDVGDKTDPNHWVESITYTKGHGEAVEKRALFIQV